MRRLLAAAASGALLVLGAGCSTAPPGGQPGPTAAPAPGASGQDGDAALRANTDAICNQAVKVSGSGRSAFNAARKGLADASATGDKVAISRAEDQVDRAIDGWSFALRDLSGLVADPGVKKSLSDIGGQVAALKKDADKVNDATLNSLGERVDEACAGT